MYRTNYLAAAIALLLATPAQAEWSGKGELGGVLARGRPGGVVHKVHAATSTGRAADVLVVPVAGALAPLDRSIKSRDRVPLHQEPDPPAGRGFRCCAGGWPA